MKIIKTITILLFCSIIIVPAIFFNFESNSASAIDNRMLTENPFSAEALASGGDLTANIESYVNDRIGFRDDMILAYTVLNDKVFGKMTHPSYVYGKDGYVFGAGLTTSADQYTEFHEAYADMVKEIQDYCEDRGVPFLFVFDPAKPAVLTEYVADGINYDRSWIDDFLAALDERGVNYLDNTVTLREKYAAGEVVFNQKYDANHWNDLGAYYGTTAMLEAMQKDNPDVHVNEPDELTISSTLQTSLPVSEFPIHEEVPAISMDLSGVENLTSLYNEEVYRHPSHQGFGYYCNEERLTEGSPRTLVFQGSYMNGFGSKYMMNALGEYIYVHDYQNVIDFAYYFNIFQPEYVVFEVGEYTLNSNYFDFDRMSAFDLNPVLSEVEKDEEKITIVQLELENPVLSVEQGETLTKIYWRTDETLRYAWLCLDREYDMTLTEQGWMVTVPTETYQTHIAHASELEIVGMMEG